MSHFFAYLARMKFIQRWGLMRNTSPENIQEHSMQVAMVAHGLAVIRNQLYGGQLNPDRIAILATFHDVSEVITGDLPTPIKYFNPQIKTVYNEIEVIARQRLYEMLPEELQPGYHSLFYDQDEDAENWKVVKAADKICAYFKCLEEKKVGNLEFAKAEKTIKADIDRLEQPEVQYFMRTFVPSFQLTLDELN